MKSLLLVAMFAIGNLLTVSAHAQNIKNPQSVLGGALTRAGVTGQKELSDEGLKSLCEKGYKSAYFLYSGARTRTVSCGSGSISYRSQSINNVNPILQDIYEGIKSGSKTFVHCNNGAHASGMVAAIALKQFCGYSSEQAFNYWSSHLAGYALQPQNMAGVRRRIDAFQPLNLPLSASERAEICH